MLSSISSHNDSLAGVPGCPPLPEGALIYGWEAHGSGGVHAGDVSMGGMSSMVLRSFSPHSNCPHRGTSAQQKHFVSHQPYPGPLNK